MAERDALGRTPEQVARERAEIARYLAPGHGYTDSLGRSAAQVQRERDEIAREVGRAERQASYQADRQARAIHNARMLVAGYDELSIEQAGEDAEQGGYSADEARRYMRERLALTFEERVDRAFADIIVNEV